MSAHFARTGKSLSRTALILALTLATSLALPMLPAHAELVQCRDAAGEVSYTNGYCPAGDRPMTMQHENAVEKMIQAASAPEIIPTRAPRHDSAWATPKASPETRSSDAATMRFARMTMDANEEIRLAANLLKRQQRSL